MSEFIIVGMDERDVEKQLALWLRDRRGIKINRVTPPNHKRPTLLKRSGGNNLPGVSMLIDYETSATVEFKEPSDVAAQFKELQDLRKKVRMAELNLRVTTMSRGGRLPH